MGGDISVKSILEIASSRVSYQDKPVGAAAPLSALGRYVELVIILSK